MTERDPSTLFTAHPDAVAELRHILDMVTQAEKLLMTATSRLEAAAAAVAPSGPPHPPPPPPWRELLPVVQRELDATAATVARAQRIVAALIQGAPGGKPGA